MKEHFPVMLKESVNAAAGVKNLRTAVDATLGLGGHSSKLLESFPELFLYAFDRDAQARAEAEIRLKPFAPRFEIIAGNFRDIASLNEHEGFKGADFILFDLGVSNLQLTEGERGFSFQNDGPLDMRMEYGAEAEGESAADLLARADVKELTRIFREYGEERYAFEIAKGIVRSREQGAELSTTGELAALIRKILPAPVQRRMGGHPARRVFQALRIAVNDEMGALEDGLDGAAQVLAPGGRVAVISYHSLEDRIVKQRFRKWKDEGTGEIVTRRPVAPTEEEITENYRSRSAKLRIFAKFEEGREEQ